MRTLGKRGIQITLGICVLGALPFILSASLLNASIQMLIAALFACAFNLLCGQAGMLSFGHAAYFGIGAFATAHAMNAVGGTGIVATPLLPITGAVAGLLFGAVAGWFATRRSGVYFAMITLAVAELLHSLAPSLGGLFGGEAGLSVTRMPAWGWTFGSATQLYYLILAWVLGSLALMYLFTLTPIGKLALGLRENQDRMRFLGYHVHGLSVFVFAVSGMFSGIAGALQTLNYEVVNYVVFDLNHSAAVVLNSYIGGVKVFLGPALGGSLMTFFGFAVSDITRSWLLYQGILFVLVMMYSPAGLAGLLRWWNVSRQNYGTKPLLPIVGLWLLTSVMLTSGAVFLVEILHRFFSQGYQSTAALSSDSDWPSIRLFGFDWSPAASTTWIIPITMLVAGIVLARFAHNRWLFLIESPVVDGGHRASAK